MGLRVVRFLEITTTIVVREMIPPAAPVIHSNTFTAKGSTMAQRTGTIQLSGVFDPTVTSIPVIVTGSTVAGQSPITVDAFNPSASFQCNDGDILNEIATQINPTGTSPVSAAVEIVVAVGIVPPSVPAAGVLPIAPVIGSNTFV